MFLSGDHAQVVPCDGPQCLNFVPAWRRPHLCGKCEYQEEEEVRRKANSIHNY